MVRPSERYRHGARRNSSPQLDPVFVLEQRPFAEYPSRGNGLYQVISGELGLRLDLDVFGSDVPAMPQPSTSDPGLIAAMTDYIVTSENISVASSSYSAPVFRYSSLLYAFQHHDVLYLTINRWAEVRHTASLVWQLEGYFGQGIIGTGTLGPTSYFVEVGDVITLAVDMQTQQFTAGTAPLLDGGVTITDYSRSASNFSIYLFSGTDNRTQEIPYLQIYDTIPSAHPLKTFGADLWKGTSPGPVVIGPFKYANIVSYQINSLLNDCLGYGDEQATQRVIRKSNVLEWAEISYSGLEQAQRLGEPWTDSFAGYSSSSLEEREEILLTDQISTADRALFLTSVSPAPSSVTPGAISAGSTSEPRFFLESPSIANDNGLSFDQGMRTFLRYRIIE